MVNSHFMDDTAPIKVLDATQRRPMQQPDTAESVARIEILGPVRVFPTGFGEPIPINAPQEQVVLTYLALRAGEAVAGFDLADSLWGDVPPASERKAVQVYISRLRKLLGNGAIVHERSSYRLTTEGIKVDAEQFRSLIRAGQEALESGDAEKASSAAASALALWRGGPVDGGHPGSGLYALAVGMGELRATGVEIRFDAELALGRHRHVVAELASAVEQYPLREHLWVQLMTAYYRCGRQADALRAYQRARLALVEEVGIAPLRELSDLEIAILNQSPALSAPTARRAPPGADEHTHTDHSPIRPHPDRTRLTDPGWVARLRESGTFSGRQEHLSMLESAWDAATRGNGSCFIIHGEPGIGKSRLAAELAHSLAGTGLILHGACSDAGSAPWAPLPDALGEYVAAAPYEILADHVRENGGDLVRVVPGLRHRLETFLPSLSRAGKEDGDLTGAGTGTGTAASQRIASAVTSLLSAAAAHDPVLLILEDLHWADCPAVKVLSALAQEAPRIALVVVGTMRSTSDVPVAKRRNALTDLREAPGWHPVELSGLDAAGLAGMLDPLLPGMIRLEANGKTKFVQSLLDHTGGNPLFVRHLLNDLAERQSRDGRKALALIEEGTVPQGIRRVILERVARLPAATHKMLQIAAVLGDELDLEILGTVTGNDISSVLGALDAAVAAGIIVQSPGRRHLAFAHRLLRDVLSSEVTPSRNAPLHLRAAEAVEGIYGTESYLYAAEVAEHLANAADVMGRSVARKAFDAACTAGRSAQAALALEDAAYWFRRALEQANTESVCDTGSRCDVLTEIGSIHRLTEGLAAARPWLEQARDLATRTGDARRLAVVAIGMAGEGVPWLPATDDGTVAVLEEAIQALGDERSVLMVRLLSALACELCVGKGMSRIAEIANRAGSIAAEMNEPEATARSLLARHMAVWSPGHAPERLELLASLLDHALHRGDRELELDARVFRLYSLIESRSRNEIDAEVSAIGRLSGRLGGRFHHWLVAAIEAMRAIGKLPLSEAEDKASAALELSRDTDIDDAWMVFGAQLGLIRFFQGRAGEIASVMEEYSDSHSDMPAWRGAAMLASALAGQLDTARAHFEEMSGDYERLPQDFLWMTCMATVAMTCVELGDTERAEGLYKILLPYGGLQAVVSHLVGTLGPVDRLLGVLAAMAGNLEQAERHFQAAMAQAKEMGSTGWAAWTACDFGQMLAGLDDPRRQERGEQLLRYGAEKAASVGWLGVVERAEKARLAARRRI